MWSAGVKVANFQNRSEPILLFIISNFTSIVKDGLAVLQQRAAAPKAAETRITYDTLLCPVVILPFFYQSYSSIYRSLIEITCPEQFYIFQTHFRQMLWLFHG